MAEHTSGRTLLSASRLLRGAVVALLLGTLAVLGGDSAYATGLTATGAQFFDQDTPGVIGGTETGDLFGATVATGDFDGDGYDDLAIGVPREDLTDTGGTVVDAGAVAVLYGDSSGLYGTSRNQFWTVSSLSGYLGGTTLTPTTDGRFGTALAVGDVNGDGYDDLAIADHKPPSALWSAQTDGLYVIYGSASGLTPTDFDRAYFYNSGCQTGGSAYHALAAGDFNGDGRADIAYGGYEEWNGDVNCYPTPPSHWGWEIFHGGSSDISYPGTWVDPDSGLCGVVDQYEPNVLEAGQFEIDGQWTGEPAELAAGYPYCGTGGGVILCLDESCDYFTGEAELWTQDSPGVYGGSEAGDQFGAALAAGDFDGDGCTDLAVGVPGEEVNPYTDQGIYEPLFGDCSGLTATGSNLIGAVQEQSGAFYGSALAAGNFDVGDTADELAIGAPGQDYTGITDAGYVDVRYLPSEVWNQDTPGVPNQNEDGDRFGSVLATGDFNGDGADDLAIGVPNEDNTEVNGVEIDAGAVTILYGEPPAGPLDTDGDGCPDVDEQQTVPGSETTGGLRDYLDPNDYYDVSSPHDGVIDLTNDILGVILHYAPTGTEPEYDVRFDRGPSAGPNAWNMTAPDGAIDLTNDILGVILQYGHNCP